VNKSDTIIYLSNFFLNVYGKKNQKYV